VIRFGGVEVGKGGWDEMVERIRQNDKERL
jgi:hypothetical protein